MWRPQTSLKLSLKHSEHSKRKFKPGRKKTVVSHAQSFACGGQLSDLVKLQILKHDEESEMNLISEIDEKREVLVDILAKKDFLVANLILESLKDETNPSLQWLMKIIIKAVLNKHPDFDARLMNKPPLNWSHSTQIASKPRRKLNTCATILKRLSRIGFPGKSSLSAAGLSPSKENSERKESRLYVEEEKDKSPAPASPVIVMEEAAEAGPPPLLPPKPKPKPRSPLPRSRKDSLEDNGKTEQGNAYENRDMDQLRVNSGELPSVSIAPAGDSSNGEETPAHDCGYQIPPSPRPAKVIETEPREKGNGTSTQDKGARKSVSKLNSKQKGKNRNGEEPDENENCCCLS